VSAKFFILIGLVPGLFLAGCRQGPPRATAIGEAFVGPATLKIRSEIALESPVAATVKHGDRLEILQRRRRFLRVRTASGAEGWTHERQLLAAADMDSLKGLAQRAAAMPVQGEATVWEALNIHTLPARQAPSFYQMQEKERVEVLAHLVAPRKDLPRAPLIPPPQKKARLAKKPAKPPKYPPPPMPRPPAPPEDWLELSKTDLEIDESEVPEEPEAAPVPTDRWSLVRTRTGQAGWALTRRLFMAIPDEVAQYAEGHRIVAYFSLGTVRDGAETKHTWLWTTRGGSAGAHDFDSFRIFIWSLRRHRYETAYIERNLRGYLPVLRRDVEYAGTGAAASPGRYPGFSVCLEKGDGQRYRREYAMLGNIVRSAGERPCEAASPLDLQTLKSPAPAAPAAAHAPPTEKAESFTQKFKRRIRSMFGG
jgi:hypothetical protein